MRLGFRAVSRKRSLALRSPFRPIASPQVSRRSGGTALATARWTDWSGQGLEHCQLSKSAEGGHRLEGAVAGTRHGLYGGHYVVLADEQFRTREVRMDYVGGPSLHVASDGKGSWHDLLSDSPIPTLEGCMDIDIGITPATNTLPIRRLRLASQQSADIFAAYVPLPDQIDGCFLPMRAEQRYTCLIPGKRYRYEGLFRNFTADLEIDHHGLVLDYPQTFRRVAEL
ncbi:putative glycolipid-binding domain-containing protein [Paracoccus albus]|uniref:putative glycolipid-binding domain-containing protein n=1 Tax=Paracoccus albus TaxID=3017784 RepID=UPI0022F0A7ED|nr:putative glycolipid-binding domain-containing protein [Paracoccus albus]WBU61968.1 putative glycolipid-binding domain-containing protein [Paracoccus albus]